MKKIYLLLKFSLWIILFASGVYAHAGDSVYIDASVEDSHTLQYACLGNATDVFHFFSHGKPGELFIEGQWLAGEQLADFLKSKLPVDVSTLYIYGCNFAQGEKGKQAAPNFFNCSQSL